MTKLRPFRFGVVCEQMAPQPAWTAKARQIEEAGYATLLLRDHLSANRSETSLLPSWR